ncbi:MAG: sulfite exporter TauE/SafE family protein [Deltaproteobacteria bacterium]|nr:sulfite exporter TauE/SafE family protein [Deltaproteobacteria bacterium]
MSFFNELGRFMMAGARAHAQWELEVSNTILGSRKRKILLGLLLIPILIGGIAFAGGEIAGGLPDVLGGKKAYSPAFYTPTIFIASILVGLGAGLITGCIGAGGGFIIAPALMSAGVKGILAVGTDLFHIFAKAIMGSVLHKKLGNVNVPLAAIFLIGAIGGATAGGMLNRYLYEINPVLSDAFITTVYVFMLGFLGFYSLMDYLRSRKAESEGDAHSDPTVGELIPPLGQKLQSVKIPPMIKFDEGITPGGREISAIFLIISGAIVGMAAGIMGVGGGFLTFPIFVYGLGVSSMTTVGTDIFQIIFTAGYAAISQYAIYGFIFYTLAMGMLLGSLFGIQIGSLVTKVVPGITIRGFYAMAVIAGFINRVFALPGKLMEMEVLNITQKTAYILEQIGIYGFFIVIGIFGVWVFVVFFRNIHILKGEATAS